MDFGSVQEVVDFAIEKEIEAANFYRKAANDQGVAANKSVLVDYAEEEEKHVKMLKDFTFDKASRTLYRFKKIEDIKRADYLVDMEYNPKMTYHEVMRVAMKREEKAYKLYQNLADNSEKEDLAEVFKILAHEELKHKTSLEKIYDDDLAQTGD